MRLRCSSVDIIRLFALAVLSCIPMSGLPLDPDPDPFSILGTLDTYEEFPATQERLDQCFAKDDQNCLALYKRFRLVVREIFDKGRQNALKRTLTAVARDCGIPQKGDPWPWAACHGATNCFYFFNTDAEDSEIILYLQRLDHSVLWNLFVESKGYSGDWTGNRPDRQRWAKFLDSLTILDKDSGGRRGFIDVFLMPAKSHSGIGLLDPDLSLGPNESKLLQVRP
jgi:hypothetical protein